jgi:hypothetical protein
MQTVSNMDWIINLDEMTCHNINTDIVVGFEKKGDAFLGKIKDLPNNIYEQWAKKENGVSLLKNILTEAENVFLRIYSENDLKTDNV